MVSKSKQKREHQGKCGSSNLGLTLIRFSTHLESRNTQLKRLWVWLTLKNTRKSLPSSFNLLTWLKNVLHLIWKIQLLLIWCARCLYATLRGNSTNLTYQMFQEKHNGITLSLSSTFSKASGFIYHVVNRYSQILEKTQWINWNYMTLMNTTSTELSNKKTKKKQSSHSSKNRILRRTCSKSPKLS